MDYWKFAADLPRTAGEFLNLGRFSGTLSPIRDVPIKVKCKDGLLEVIDIKVDPVEGIIIITSDTFQPWVD